MREAGGQLRFEVRDDGVGFTPAGTVNGGGLTNMRDRVAALGGVLRVTSSPGAGTRVRGTVPLADQNERDYEALMDAVGDGRIVVERESD